MEAANMEATAEKARQSPMTQEDAASAIVAYMFSRVIGSSKNKEVTYSLLEATDNTFSWIAAITEKGSTGQPVDRYRVDIDRLSGKIQPRTQISVSEAELRETILAATGHHLKEFSKIPNGAPNVLYKVSIEEDPDIRYVVQLHHYGRVASMDLLMGFISSNINPNVLPLPAVYPIPGEEQRQRETGMGRQIARLIPGPTADTVYPLMSLEAKLEFVRKMALAFQAIWSIPLPKKHLIGELSAVQTGDCTILTIGPDRHRHLGPYTSVRDYLRSFIRFSLEILKRHKGIDEYKTRFLQRITDFVEGGMHNIPAIVEHVPIVATHTDMAPYNVILSPTTHTDINAIIDWEFIASAPFATQDRVIEMLFRTYASNGFGPEYEHADKLRDAFWGAVPEWKKWNESDATRVFLEWFRFGRFMKAEKRPPGLNEEEKEAYWAQNVRVVEGLLEKYGCAHATG